MPTRIVSLAAAIMLTLAAIGTGAEPTYSRVLLPLIVHEPGLTGANGSRWVTSLSVFNANSSLVIVAQQPYQCPFDGCYPIEWQAHSVVVPALPTATSGAFIYVADLEGRIDPKRVVFHLRAQDMSRQSETWGTEIPVIREDDYSGTAIHLLDVPLDRRFRQTIRIYDAAARDTDVVIRVRRTEPDRSSEIVAERHVTLVAPKPQASDFPVYPAYRQLGDVLAEFPQVAGLERVHIEVIPLTTGSKIWAFASITHNDTQHVTLITPH